MKVTVAIVEDDPSTREIIAEWIDQTAKFRCLGKYENVARAVAALEEVYRGGSPMSGSIARKVARFFQEFPGGNQPVLSPRELEVLQLVAQGYVNEEISDRLGLSEPTIATYIRRIYEKLHVHSREAAVGKFSLLTMAKGSEFAGSIKGPERPRLGSDT